MAHDPGDEPKVDLEEEVPTTASQPEPPDA